MRPGRRIHARLAELAAVVAIGLSSCASAPEDPKTTPEDALTEVLALIESAQHIIGGDWEKHDYGAQSCPLPSGTTGASHAAMRLGPPIPKAEQGEIVDRIVNSWTDSGYPPAVLAVPETEGVEVTRLLYPGAGRGEDGLYLSVEIADTGSAVETRSRCFPGSAADINRDDAADLP